MTCTTRVLPPPSLWNLRPKGPTTPTLVPGRHRMIVPATGPQGRLEAYREACPLCVSYTLWTGVHRHTHEVLDFFIPSCMPAKAKKKPCQQLSTHQQAPPRPAPPCPAHLDHLHALHIVGCATVVGADQR
jgi:hypothetical protein